MLAQNFSLRGKLFAAKFSKLRNSNAGSSVLSSVEFITATRVVQEFSPANAGWTGGARTLFDSARGPDPNAEYAADGDLLAGKRFTGQRGVIYTFSFSHWEFVDRSPTPFMPKRTFQPNRRRRSKTHGFRTRMKTKSGRAVISRRRAKGRKRVSVKPGFRE